MSTKKAKIGSLQLENPLSFSSSSPYQTQKIGRDLGSLLTINSVIALCGNLGAGKTTFVQGLALSLGIDEREMVSSPTFSYIHIYAGKIPLFHFDLYRIPNAEAFHSSGFEEYFFSGGISCIEWPEVALGYLPSNTLLIKIETSRDHKNRIITLQRLSHD